jgi:DNA-binding IclR family transcriptional regulator
VTKSGTEPGPAQTVARAVQLLRLVASSKVRNLRLVDIAELASLDKSTAHRILQRLVRERMLVHDSRMGGYRLGPLLYELGLNAVPGASFGEASYRALEELAHATGDMSFLVVRSGSETVCLQRIMGNFPICTMTQGLGDRHPLGVGAGGLAILAALPESERDVLLEALAPRLRRYQLTISQVCERVRLVRERGYAIDEGSAALNVTAIGRAIHDPGLSPAAAVFVASISGRMGEAQLRRVDRQLIACVKAVESTWRSQAVAPRSS